MVRNYIRKVRVVTIVRDAQENAVASPGHTTHHAEPSPPSLPVREGPAVDAPTQPQKKRGRPPLRALRGRLGAPSPASPQQKAARQVDTPVAVQRSGQAAGAGGSEVEPQTASTPTSSFPSAPASTETAVATTVDVAPASDLSAGTPMLPESLRRPSATCGPPSLLGCLAACFGWQLASCAVSEDGEVQFGLRHAADTSLRATVRAPRDAFERTADTSSAMRAAHVFVNEAAVSLADCPLVLHRLSQRQPAVEAEAPPQSPSSPRLVSPAVQPPPELSAVGRAAARQRRAKKRARSRSPSPPPPPPQSASLSSSSSGVPRERSAERDNVAAPQEPSVQGEEQDRSDLWTSSTSSSIENGSLVKVELTTSPFTTPPLTHLRDSQPREIAEQNDVGDVTLASLYASAAVGVAGETDTSPPLRSPEVPATPAETYATAVSVSAPATGAAQGKSAPSSMRSRRHSAVAAAGTASAASLTANAGDPVSPGHGHTSSSMAAPFSLHNGVARGSFYMPYMTLASASSASTTNTSAGGSGSSAGHSGLAASKTESRDEITNGAPRRITAFRGLDGWSGESSRRWLAHTHAVSRSFEVAPASRALDTHTGNEVPLHGDCQGAAGQEGEEEEAKVTATVRATLRQRWLHRSSLWSSMEASLRLSVGSGRLRGDALEAGVQALQASEEEHVQYDGQRMHDQPEEEEKEEGAASPRAVAHCTFPSLPPRPLLPVSGKAVVEAQHRIAAAEEAEATARSSGSDGSCPPRYTVYAGGIPAADRLLIDRTYTTRGSYVVATSPLSLQTCAVKKEEDTAEEGASDPCALAPDVAGQPSLLPVLSVNPQEDLHYHVYKRCCPKDMREALEAEGTLAIGPDGIGPVNYASGDSVLPATKATVGSPNTDNDDGDDGDEDADEEEEEASERKDETSPLPVTKPEQASTTQTAAAPGAEWLGSTDIDYILYYRPAIGRIPMPDVESRYGL